MILFLAAVGALASRGDLVTAEKGAAPCFMEKQVRCGGLLELRSQWPGGVGGEKEEEVEEEAELPSLHVAQQLDFRYDRVEEVKLEVTVCRSSPSTASLLVRPSVPPSIRPSDCLSPSTQETELPHCQNLPDSSCFFPPPSSVFESDKTQNQ